MNKNFKKYLLKYFEGLSIPKISKDESIVLVEEIIRMIEILESNPDISYDELWDKIHEIERK